MLPLIVAVLLQAPSQPPASQNPDTSVHVVTGNWRFNTQDSDRPPGPGGDSTGARRGRGGPGGGGGGYPGGGGEGGFGGRGGRGGMGGGGFGGGRGAPGAGGGGGGDYQDRAARLNFFQIAFRSPQHLDLTELRDTLRLVADADSVALPTNGHKVSRSGPANVDIEVRARRRDGRLEVERKVGSAGKITETYFISPRGGQLFVVVKVEPTGRDAMTFRRIYEPAAPAAAPASQ